MTEKIATPEEQAALIELVYNNFKKELKDNIEFKMQWVNLAYHILKEVCEEETKPKKRKIRKPLNTKK